VFSTGLEQGLENVCSSEGLRAKEEMYSVGLPCATLP